MNFTVKQIKNKEVTYNDIGDYMNPIYYLENENEKIDLKSVEQTTRVKKLQEEIKTGSIPAYLELLDSCTPMAFHKIMNDVIEINGRKKKLKECIFIEKQRILVYPVLIKNEESFVYRTFYEYNNETQDILRYYKRNQTMFALINEAILKGDLEFLESIFPYLKLFPCYDCWTKEERLTKKLTKR